MKRSLAAMAALAVVAATAPTIQSAQTSNVQQVRATTDGAQNNTAKAQPAQDKNRRTTPVRMVGWGEMPRSYYRRARPGWTNRHVQRTAAKRRNQARHRKACR